MTWTRDSENTCRQPEQKTLRSSSSSSSASLIFEPVPGSSRISKQSALCGLPAALDAASAEKHYVPHAAHFGSGDAFNDDKIIDTALLYKAALVSEDPAPFHAFNRDWLVAFFNRGHE